MTYEWERKFQSHILSRGWNYAMDGMVSGIQKNGDTVTAVVEGTEYYRVEAFISLKIQNLIIQRILNGKVSEKL